MVRIRMEEIKMWESLKFLRNGIMNIEIRIVNI